MGQAGIFGKHPAFGDFIGAGMSKPMQVKLEEWLGAVLPHVRDNLGDVWQPFYDIALPLRFWLGEGVLPRDVPGPVAGVMVFSHDKVGRRFPLVALTEAGHMPPPTVDPDQRWYDALQDLMLEHDTPETASELADMLTLPASVDPVPSQASEASFWAVHQAGAVSEMLKNVAMTDHRSAARQRSYWWCAGDRSRTATFHTLEGWPGADVFQWLLAGNPADEPEPELPPQPEPDAFLSSAAVALAEEDSTEQPDDPWADGASPRVPPALYVDFDALPEPGDGPQSPFSAPADQDDVEDTGSENDEIAVDLIEMEGEPVDEADATLDADDSDREESVDQTSEPPETEDQIPAKPDSDALADEAE